jgi:pimeloyl-ACP methyl ester carboxylesterase
VLARLQRRLLAGLALAMLLAIAAGIALGHALVGVLVALCLASSFTLVLAVEFVLMAVVHADDPTPRASLPTLLSAWWTECVAACWVFNWQQPFREHVQADVPGLPGVRGIVFVHGYLCNRAIWNPWLAHCARLGVPCVAVSLEPVFGELAPYAVQVERAVAQLERQTGLAPVLVCHSMGGLVARAWMATVPGADARVHRTITIGSPHGGTWLARLSSTVNAHHMRPANGWLRGLAASEPAGRYEHFTCFFGHADNIVFPPLSATLPGADNRHLAATPHVAMAFHPAVMTEVLRWLPAQPRRS